jgi:hypothetical protein
VTPLQPLEIFILECFRERSADRLSVWDIIGKSTDHRHKALVAALDALESEHGMLAKSGPAYELTERGMQYIGR